jgi:glycerol-3-phosphate dehydrogenase
VAPAVLKRWARLYGSRVELLMKNGAGPEIVPGVHEAELRYLVEHEWACRANDILWRRTKLGLHLDERQRAAVATWCEAHVPEYGLEKSLLEKSWS